MRKILTALVVVIPLLLSIATVATTQSNPCATVRCAAGSHCAVKAEACNKPPCRHVGVCVPDPTCATTPCAAGSRCVMEKNAGCATCPAVPRCVAFCPKGTTFTRDCNTCTCDPRTGAVTCTRRVCG